MKNEIEYTILIILWQNLQIWDINIDKSFVGLYAKESRLLLECLKGTDPIIEKQLLEAIENAEKISRQ